MNLTLKDKSVVVTGGGSNIGRAIVLGFAVEGAHITIGDLDEGQAEKVAKLARQKGAASDQAIKTDVTDMDQVKAMFKAATDKNRYRRCTGQQCGLGPVHVLHPDHAGALAEDHPDQLWACSTAPNACSTS